MEVMGDFVEAYVRFTGSTCSRSRPGYTKAGATQSLARFYDACAQVRTFIGKVITNCDLCDQVEIDDYRDYEKAASAYQEAIKSVAKGNQDTMSVENAEIQTRINRKLTFIKKFLNIRM